MSAARRLAKSKENYLAETFEVVCNCGWADEGTGFMGHVLYAFEHIFATHPDRTELIIETLVDWLRPRANGKDDSGINEKDMRKLSFLTDIQVMESMQITKFCLSGEERKLNEKYY